MSNQLIDLLQQWSGRRDDARWVLGTVYGTERSSYRKAGAMMLFNDLGQQFGLLSGGCLESDMHRKARQVMDSGRALSLCYDGADEDDVSYQFGIGCGGLVRILLQPVTREHDYLALPDVLAALEARQQGVYAQLISGVGAVRCTFAVLDDATRRTSLHQSRGRLVQRGADCWLETPILPVPHLLIVGGGADAAPVVNLAKVLGWEVSVCDHRPAHARSELFLRADRLLRCRPEELPDQAVFSQLDAAILMSHSLSMDAAGLRALQQARLHYLALLGPAPRRDEALRLAGLDAKPVTPPLAAPAGLDLGADLPEGIALSMLAECHAVLTGTEVQPLSHPDRAQWPIRRADP